MCLATLVLWFDRACGQDLCRSFASDSVPMRVSGTRRCDALIPQDLQRGAVGQCWYSWSLNGHEIVLSNYLILRRAKYDIQWIYGPNSSPDDELLNGSYYISKGKHLIIVSIENGLVSSIMTKSNTGFEKDDFSVMNECQLPIVINTSGMYYGWLTSGPIGWDITTVSIIHNPDGTTSRVNGSYPNAIKTRLREKY